MTIGGMYRDESVQIQHNSPPGNGVAGLLFVRLLTGFALELSIVYY